MAGIAAGGDLTRVRNATPAWELSLAAPDDDDGLRALLRRAVIPGAVRVAFTREPRYSAGEGLAGTDDVTLVARRGGEVAAMGRCSIRTLHRNGQLQRIGYLSELRVDPATPSSARLLRDGYAMLAEAATERGVDGFFTSITADNTRARRVLERGRRLGLPPYVALASLVTLLAPVRVGVGSEGDDTRCTASDREAVMALLQRHAPEAHLTLPWALAQWTALAVHGVSWQDVVVVRRGGTIVAAAIIWDQRPFRQTVIDGYGGALQLTAPLVNLLQRLRRLPPLPPPGGVLPQGSLLGVTVPEVHDWPALWRALQQRAAARGIAWLALARDARDPQLPDLQRLLRAREYRTTLYDVTWRGRPGWDDAWDDRVVRPDAGLL